MATVLVIDDDDDVRKLIARALAERYDVIEASDAAAALALAADRRLDLIVCDVMMPRMSGFELVRELRARDGGNHVPIVFLTAKSGAMDVVEGINAGARAYVTKPFKLAPLVERIEKILATPRGAAGQSR
ncbi:MAG TPA: response regulator [Polyangiaceae bacterium]|jgi:DNA-binding response OmpR family regulator